MFVCPECHHPITKPIAACPECGLPFDDFPLSALSPCVKCNQEIPEGKQICPLCGTEQTLDDTSESPSEPAPNPTSVSRQDNRRLKWSIIGSLIVVATLFGILIVARGTEGLLDNKPDTTVLLHRNMKNLQTMVEVYAVDWGGQYPASLSALHTASTQPGHSYWKNVTNPFTQKQGMGNEGSMIDSKDFQVGHSPGVVVYIPGGSPIIRYWIYGSDETGNIIQKDGQDMVLSNSSDKPQSFEQVKELVLASSQIPSQDSPAPTSQQIISIPPQEITATASTSIRMTSKRATVDFTPDKVLDNDYKTNWQEDAPGSGVGEWIQLSFHQPRQVQSLDIRNGYADANDPEYGNLFEKNNRVKDLQITYSNGKSITTTLEDSLGLQGILFGSQEPITWVRFTIKSVYKGRKYDDTCISDIIVNGYQQIRP